MGGEDNWNYEYKVHIKTDIKSHVLPEVEELQSEEKLYYSCTPKKTNAHPWATPEHRSTPINMQTLREGGQSVTCRDITDASQQFLTVTRCFGIDRSSAQWEHWPLHASLYLTAFKKMTNSNFKSSIVEALAHVSQAALSKSVHLNYKQTQHVCRVHRLDSDGDYCGQQGEQSWQVWKSPLYGRFLQVISPSCETVRTNKLIADFLNPTESLVRALPKKLSNVCVYYTITSMIPQRAALA